MNKSFIIFLTLLFPSESIIFPNTDLNTGVAYIENAQVKGSTFSWELHFKRTNEWAPGNALGVCEANFNFNHGALNSPVVDIAKGGPLDNLNYVVSVSIVGISVEIGEALPSGGVCRSSGSSLCASAAVWSIVPSYILQTCNTLGSNTDQ